MSDTRRAVWLLVLMGLGPLPALAAKSPNDHAAHHPATAASQPSAAMGRFNDQMTTMQAMHEKMLAAKTPEERAALMHDHTKAMQDGMTMMGQTEGGMGTVGGNCAMNTGKTPRGCGDRPLKRGGMPAAHDEMNRRMDMMQMMMQLMVDRQDATTTGPAMATPTR
jgi:hypothetical protein